MSDGARAGDDHWHAAPDRLDDPDIRRSLFGRFLISASKRVTRGHAYHFMRVLSVDRRLHLPYLLWNSRLMPRGKLPRKHTEAVVIHTAWRCRSQYEWVQHRAIGRRKAGLTREQVDAAGPDPQSDVFDEETRLLLAGVDELLDDHRLSDATWDGLRAFMSPRLILEYIMLVGTYAALGGALNSFGTPLEKIWNES